MAAPPIPSITSSSSAKSDGQQSQYVGPNMVNFAAPGGNSTLLIAGAVIAGLFIYMKWGKK